MLIFWLRDEEGCFFFPFMYLEFWLQENLEIQYISRFLLCFIVFYFTFCPARIISYRKENTVETRILGEPFHSHFFFPSSLANHRQNALPLVSQAGREMKR